MNVYADSMHSHTNQLMGSAAAHGHDRSEQERSVLAPRSMRNGLGIVMQRKLQDMADFSPSAQKASTFQAMADNSENVRNTAQWQVTPSMASSRLPVQRQVPEGDEEEKPVAETGSYTARGGDGTIYSKREHPRHSFQLGSKTRYEVFANYNPQYAGNRIISIFLSDGGHTNVEGVQLDHRRSWDDISDTMNRNNENPASLFKYTHWDAKMYYNDQPNLHPVLANLNAAAGANGVDNVSRLHYGLESGAGDLQTAWMNLQQTLSGMSPSIGESAVDPIWIRLNAITQNMNQLSEDLVKADW